MKELDEFYVAEEYHQNYYNENPNQGYCRAVIKPKMSKFKALFEKYIDLSRLWNVIIPIILTGVIFCFEGRLSTLKLRYAYNKPEKYFILTVLDSILL